MGTLSPTEAGTALARALLAELILTLITVGKYRDTGIIICVFGWPGSHWKGRMPYIIFSWLLLILLCIDTFVDADYLYRSLMKSADPSDFPGRRSKEGCTHALQMPPFMGQQASLCGCTSSTISVLNSVWRSVSRAGSPESKIWAGGDLTFGALWVFASVATNISLTTLIAWRLVQARTNVTLANSSAGPAHLKLYSDLLSVLVESASPLSVSGIGYAISIMALTKPGTPENARKEAASVVFAGMYVAFAVRAH